MRWIVIGLVLLFLLRLVIGAIRGRVRIRPCCPADPRDDVRMRGAWDEPGKGS